VEPSRLRDLLDAGRDVGLEILVEVRDEAELELALIYQADLIGVNNRNLETLEIDPGNAARIIPFIPASLVAIAESGVKSADDVSRLAEIGADAVLVGSELSGSADPQSAVRALSKFKRVAGARKG
jgi:indole-3-glycerol phosphate synthase